MTYDAIKALAKARGCRINDLIALAPANDPFYCGMPQQREAAEWFAELWRRLKAGPGGDTRHVRRMHYRALHISGLTLPNGTAYENTKGCWKAMVEASKAARYLGLVDPAHLIDRRTPAPRLVDFSKPDPHIEIVNTEPLRPWEFRLPSLPEWPEYVAEGWGEDQPVHLELWVEKSGDVDDVLLPLAERYHLVLQSGIGEFSITRALDLVTRLHGQPCRILYLSDFDPGGQSMPVAVARKIEFFLRTREIQADVRLYHIALTPAQVRKYRLPRIPIRESEHRREAFEERFGEGAVELDALESLHPGELRRILQTAIEHYYDPTLCERVFDLKYDLVNQADAITEDLHDAYRAELDAIEEEHATLTATFEERHAALFSRVAALRARFAGVLEARAEDLAFRLPDARPVEELPDPLFDSTRVYLDQLASYKAFQGRGPHPPRGSKTHGGGQPAADAALPDQESECV